MRLQTFIALLLPALALGSVLKPRDACTTHASPTTCNLFFRTNTGVPRATDNQVQPLYAFAAVYNSVCDNLGWTTQSIQGPTRIQLSGGKKDVWIDTQMTEDFIFLTPRYTQSLTATPLDWRSCRCYMWDTSGNKEWWCECAFECQ